MKFSPSYLRKLLFLLGFVAAAVLSGQDAFYSYELPLLDLRFRLRPSFQELAPLAVIEVDNSTLHNLGTWPIRRNFYALLLRALHKAEARAVVFDIFFSEPTHYDLVLAQAIKNNARVYLPLAFELNRKAPSLPAAAQRIIAGERKEFLVSAAGAGHINTYVDKDGKIRAVPLLIDYKGRIIPQISLRAALDILGLRLKDIRIEKRRIVIGGRLALPLDTKGRFLVNYAGKWGVFDHFSFLDILRSYQMQTAGEKPLVDLRRLKGKVCFVGLTASGTTDIRAVPLDKNYPQVGVLANVFNSIYLKRFIKDEPVILRVAVGMLLPLLALFFSLRFSLVQGLIYLLGMFFLYAAAAFLLFIKWGVWIRMFLPLGLFLVFYLVGALWRAAQEIKKRQMLEKELEIARSIQKSFLPRKKENPSFMEIESFFQPARFVAGDLYDFYPFSENKYGIFIADVSGKGVPAALIMAQTVTLFRLLAAEFSPAEVLQKINRQLCEVLKGKFVTALYLVYDAISRKIEVCSAGHTPLVFWRAAQKKVELIDPEAGPPLGILKSVVYNNFQLVAEKGDIIVLYTDGVTEARSRRKEDFGEERLKEAVRSGAAMPLPRLREYIAQGIFSFSRNAKQHDDITFVLIKFP